jgi:NAD(P)-dependent dehydrogenase (short-subunit alcohol dehydrogenase family)
MSRHTADTHAGRVAVVAGASPGLGRALCRVLGERGHRVVALGRPAALERLAAETPGVRPRACDLGVPAEVDAAFEDVEGREGSPSLVVYTAHRLELRPFAETPLEVFEAVWRANCFGAAVVAHRALPAMLAAGAGALLFAGATASVRGGKRSAAFAASKFALRGLVQSLAREYGPRGIHVAHVVLDGLIWSPQTVARFAPDEGDCMSPDDVAAALVAIAAQPRSAWTHELDLRPYKERF